MTKYSGLVGYVTQEQTSPGIWSSVEHPKKMKGDILRQTSSTQNDDKVNSDVTLSHRVSLIGDYHAFDYYFNIKWVELYGRKWEVSSVEIQRPRLILTLGGPWNG